MAMTTIDPAWAGKVQFYELIFGLAPAYVVLVLIWEKALRVRQPEWIYVLITFLCAGEYWLNHYFQYAPFWQTAQFTYLGLFLIVSWLIAVRPQHRGLWWQMAATLSSILFAIAYSQFESIARSGVSRGGVNEFWYMAAAYPMIVTLIVWRGRAMHTPNP